MIGWAIERFFCTVEAGGEVLDRVSYRLGPLVTDFLAAMYFMVVGLPYLCLCFNLGILVRLARLFRRK